MTNKWKFSIVFGITCFALTAGICIQIRSVKNLNGKGSSNYEDNNLRAEVLKYKEKYDRIISDTERLDSELNSKIETATQNDEQLKEKKDQINNANKLIGLTDVTGPGVIITVADSDKDANSVLDPNTLLVHDKDILNIVNELKNSGAEAISINGQRVIFTTPIICGGNIITINGEKIGSPFEIKAIGLPETLANIERPGGTFDSLKNRSIKPTLKKQNNISIAKYSGVLNFKYATSK